MRNPASLPYFVIPRERSNLKNNYLLNLKRAHHIHTQFHACGERQRKARSHETVVVHAYEDPRRARNPRCGYVVYLHQCCAAAKVAVNRPVAVMHLRRPQQTGKPTAAIIADYHFHFERKLPRGEAKEPRARASPRSTCERARIPKLGNPVNSLRARRVRRSSSEFKHM